VWPWLDHVYSLTCTVLLFPLRFLIHAFLTEVSLQIISRCELLIHGLLLNDTNSSWHVGINVRFNIAAPVVLAWNIE